MSRAIRAFVLTVSLACSVLGQGCDSKSPATGEPEFPKSPPSTDPSSCEPEQTGKAGAKETSRYLGDIGKERFIEAKPIGDPIEIRFDFSGKKVYAFDYSQQVESLSDMGATSREAGGMSQKMDAKGALILKSKGDHTGTLVLKDMKATMVMTPMKGEQARSMEMQPPTMAIPNVKEDGTMEGGAANAQPLLKLLFPIPPKPLKATESAEISVNMPFNAMGSPLTVKGSSKVTHAGYVTIDGKTCARLESEINISQLDVPKELAGKYGCSTKGRSIYYFDVEAKEFVSGETAVLMKVSSETKLPTFNIPQQEKPADLPKSVQMTMASDNLIVIKRNPTLAKREADEK